jgi:hypothetical protein
LKKNENMKSEQEPIVDDFFSPPGPELLPPQSAQAEQQRAEVSMQFTTLHAGAGLAVALTALWRHLRSNKRL